jgi:hypothetical protein
LSRIPQPARGVGSRDADRGCFLAPVNRDANFDARGIGLRRASRLSTATRQLYVKPVTS